MKIRPVEEKDLEQINEIYNWHSENGFSTFCDPEPLSKRHEWFRRFDSPRHIALISEENGRVTGVTCSFAYRGGGVFKDTVETSIYLHPDSMGKGLGSKLYSELFNRLEGTGIHRVVVGIAIPNEGSVGIHRKFGFDEIGTFDEYAFYKGEYRSSVWMQKRMP